MISRLDLVSDLLSIFEIFDVFWKFFWVVFLDKYVKTWTMEKDSKRSRKKGTRAERSAAEVGVSGGGEASPPSFASWCFA